ncbi:hypothetical protein ACS0TY_025353 [Phlomoides rotata]
MTSHAWLMVLGLASLACLASGRFDPLSQQKNIFILAGQSNMAGRGQEICTYCKPGPNILKLNPALQWEEARDPLHKGIDKNKTEGVGPGMPFATRLLELKPGYGVIGLVPCASGGTSLAWWQKDSNYENLYVNLIERSRASLKEGGVIRALLWYQGEADSASVVTSIYGEKFKKFVSDVRTDLQLPNLPVIQVAINKRLDQEDSEIRKQQLGVKFPNVVTVDAKGSSYILADSIHLDTAGATHVGQMLAEAFVNNFA